MTLSDNMALSEALHFSKSMIAGLDVIPLTFSEGEEMPIFLSYPATE